MGAKNMWRRHVRALHASGACAIGSKVGERSRLCTRTNPNLIKRVMSFYVRQCRVFWSRRRPRALVLPLVLGLHRRVRQVGVICARRTIRRMFQYPNIRNIFLDTLI